MQIAPRTAVVGVLLSIAATSASALGIGRSTNNTVLGQRLDFSVVLRQEPDEFVDAECVSAEITAGDNRVPPPLVRVALDGDGNSRERNLRVTTTALIDEPVVTVTIGVGCPPRLSRTFVTFVDPPTVQLAQQAPAAAPAPPPATTPATTPATSNGTPMAAVAPPPAAQPPAADEPPRRARAAPRAAPRPRPASDARPAAPVSLPPASRPRTPTAQTARSAAPAATGPRLRLEAAAPAAPTRSSEAALQAERAAVAAAAASAAAAAAAEAASAAAAQDAARLKLLEDSLARLRAEAAATNESLATLRARVQQAEAQRYANPLVYTLAGLVAVLAALLAVVMWRHSRERQAQWWAAEQASGRADAAPTPSRIAEARDSDMDSRFGDSQGGASVIESLPPTPTLSPETRPAVAEPRREVSVEELIDLEQQAEFFVVLGQDEAAIDLLMNHLRSTGGISPLPYLKLLEIYRRRGEHEPYERIRERFNRRFNAYAPEWGTDPTQGKSLEDYPDVMGRIASLWDTPQRAMDELEALLFRRDEGETFDLPAYAEVLFLYSLARDRLGRPDDAQASAVDILLPLDGGTGGGSGIRRLTSTMPLEAQPKAEQPLNLDLDVSGEPNERRERYMGGDFSFGSGWGDSLKPPRK